jgi:hypothetical protein
MLRATLLEPMRYWLHGDDASTYAGKAMMTFNLILGVVLFALYLVAWMMVILLGLELAPRRLRVESVRMYGPLPAGGSPVQKTEPNAPDRQGNLAPKVSSIDEENEMKLREIAVAAALTVGATACHSATQGVNADKADHAHGADVTSVPSHAETSSTANVSDDPKPTNGPLGPEYRTIDSFAEFRKKLLADGWKPVVNPNCHDAVLGASYDQTCKKHPDDISCRVCDLVPEIFIYTSDGYLTARYTRNGTPLYVVAYGDIQDLENPGKYGLVVTAWGYESLK